MVDYLTRLHYTKEAEGAFPVARQGMEKLNELYNIDELISQVRGLDNNSIIASCRLTGFDSVYRAGYYSPVREITPDEQTCSNIRQMVERCKVFVENMGGNDGVICGPTFHYGYTDTISYGDADLCTDFVMCDIKTSKKPPDKNDTLQVFIYFLLACHDGGFGALDSIALFNPRTNIQYFQYVYDIDPEIRREIELDVIGYEKPDEVLEYVGSVKPMSKEEWKQLGSKFNDWSS